MTPDEAKSADTWEWLDKAAGDLASARVLIDAGHLSNALFHSQQAGEKAMKAFLT